MPRAWKQIGEGGNAIVWASGDAAVKRLKPNPNVEARARFERECTLMTSMRSRDDLKVVPTREVRRREGADEIVMDRLDGSLENVTDRFRCAPAKAARALLPVVNTLTILAEGEPRVHHRDLKPSNLLFRGDECDLYLADFGCAFLSDGERITPNHRAIGAWAFRPPEFSGDRVETVDEKGDVFSMGKVLWSMINGVPKLTFPGPVWFLPDYDLTTICGASPRTAEAMYVVGRCCDIRAHNRPTMRELEAMLKSLASIPSTPGSGLDAVALKTEQQQEVEYLQRKAIARPFVRRLLDDLDAALIGLHQDNPASLTFETWLVEWRRVPTHRDLVLDQVVDHECDFPVLNVLRRKRQLFTRFYPDGMNGPLRFYAAYGPENEQHLSPRLTVEALRDGLWAKIESLPGMPERAPYEANTIAAFLIRAIAEVG